jgi:hypothetical protein
MRLVARALLCMLLMSPGAVTAGPLTNPAACAALRYNLERGGNWTPERVSQLYWGCMGRAASMKRAATQLGDPAALDDRERMLDAPPVDCGTCGDNAYPGESE